MIRSLTLGVPVFTESTALLAEKLVIFRQASEKLSKANQLDVRTTRLSLPPPKLYQDVTPGSLRSILDSVRKLAQVAGARWYCLPIDLLNDSGRESLLDDVQSLLIRDSQLFINLITATDSTISMSGARSASRFVLNLARRSSNGIDNFRVGISAACTAGTPFFPFARHDGGELNFSIAMETASIAIELATTARAEGWSLKFFQSSLIDRLVISMRRIEQFGLELEHKTGIKYIGLDASLAPFPDGSTSIAHVIELMGPTPIGCYGTVFMTSVLTDAIKHAAHLGNIKLVGFNGVMFSVLEDNGLTNANNFRALSIDKLALYSTVCGCGIDMVPVPSTMFQEDIAALILDISALAIRLKKPLGVRLLPIPNKIANEYTQLNLDFLCDSRVMDIGVSSSKQYLCDDIWRYNTERN